jgi:hypothetical protein
MRFAWPVLALGLVTLAGLRLGGIAGTVASYPALGVFPGLAAALVLGWRWSRGRRWLIGLTLSPLVSAAAGWTLMAAGLPLPSAARAVALVGFAAWALLEALRARHGEAPPDEGEPLPALVRWWSLGLAAAIALPPLLNPFVYVHNDGWVHAALTWEIAVRGLPPQDPRFAGMPLNYVWFYNLFVALYTSLPGPGGAARHDPFIVMALLNVTVMALFTRFAYRLGYAVWRDREAASGAALLMTLGFNACAWLLWPLRLVTAFSGEVRGIAEVRRILHDAYLLDDRVFFALGAPFAHPVNFLDKFLLGSPLAYTWLLTLFYLDALAEWVRTARAELLVWAALATSGMLLFHAAPGISVIPVALGALVLALLLRRRWPWLPGPGRLAGFAAATLLGALAVLPYMVSITRGWSHAGVREPPLHLGVVMLWTLITSCGVGLAFAWRPLRRLVAERRPEGTMLLFYLAGMAAFALVVHLPEDNEHKFAFQVFVPVAVIGGAAFLPAVRGWFRRWGAARAVGLLAALSLGHVLMLNGYLLDPRGPTAPELHGAPGEDRLYAWMRDSTDARAVFVDARFRDLIMVRGRRRLYYGSVFGSSRAGFPPAQVIERRNVMADLYGPGDDLAGDARSLAALGPQALIVYRPGDDGDGSGHAAPWRNLERRPELFSRAYDRDGFRVYAVARSIGR